MNRKERRAAQRQSAAAGLGGTNAELLGEAQRAHRDGDSARVERLCRELLSREPSHAEAMNLLGVSAQAAGRHKPAASWLKKAIAADGGNAAYHYNVAFSLVALGEEADASEHFSQAIALGMNGGNVEEFILENPVIAGEVGRIQGHVGLGEPTPFGEAGISEIAEDLFLRCALQSVLLRGVPLEQFLTRLRREMLQTAPVEKPDIPEKTLQLLSALAQQCFTNEYVFALTPAEAGEADRLAERLAQQISSGQKPASILIAAVAAYRPLHRVSDAGRLIGPGYPACIEALLRQQITEPLVERQNRETIPALTAIDNPVSIEVMQQYEENPYPRWMNRFEAAPETDRASEILVAGCGTGQHAVQTALRFPQARILAVDISRASLAYAQRRTRELGIRNIEYGQADLLKLAALGRSFDRIEVVGVLHHLADPEAGWRILLSLLKPGGVMRVGLYSVSARRAVVEARALIAERGYKPTAEDIRKCRQEIIADPDSSRWRAIISSADFYSLSGCRDLLFNVMEHQFTIDRIKAFVTANNLAFRGFDAEPQVLAQFQERYADPAALNDLERWNAFEADHPRSFRYMYVFMVEKTAASPAH